MSPASFRSTPARPSWSCQQHFNLFFSMLTTAPYFFRQLPIPEHFITKAGTGSSLVCAVLAVYTTVCTRVIKSPNSYFLRHCSASADRYNRFRTHLNISSSTETNTGRQESVTLLELIQSSAHQKHQASLTISICLPKLPELYSQ